MNALLIEELSQNNCLIVMTGVVGEAQIRYYERFINDYSNQLKDIEEALDGGSEEIWDGVLDPVALKVCFRTRISY